MTDPNDLREEDWEPLHDGCHICGTCDIDCWDCISESDFQ